MATRLPNQIFSPNSNLSITSRQSKLTGISFRPVKLPRSTRKLTLKCSLVDSSRTESVGGDIKKLVDFLYEDLPHLFDEQGIDPTMYDESVKFRDPITKHDSISGYLFNIALLKKLFTPEFQLHWAKQTGPNEITTRWTMIMPFGILPWKPELVFTGTSVMGINPKNQKFCSHLDFWDSIKNNDYFSVEGLLDVIKQLRPYKTPDLETPKYQILRRTATYEVRKYFPFVIVEKKGEKLAGSTGFNDVAGYIFGKNSTKEKIKMTTPVFTQAFDNEQSNISIQIVLPSEKDLSSLPEPELEALSLRKVEGGYAVVTKFSGKPTDEVVSEKEKSLRRAVLRDGLNPKEGCMLARYNDPGRTWSFILVMLVRDQVVGTMAGGIGVAQWLGVLRGIKWAGAFGCSRIIISSDSNTVISDFKAKNVPWFIYTRWIKA